jgi:hypothetical protein
VESCHHEWPAGVSSLCQVGLNPVIPSISQSSDVLSDDPTGSQFAHQPQHFDPQSASGAVDADSFAGLANVLTGEAAANKVNWANVVSFELAHIAVDGHAWPMMGEMSATPCVDLAESDGAHAGSFKSETERTDAAEEIEDIHCSALVMGCCGP